MIIMSNNQWKNDNNLPAWAERGEDCSAEARVDGLVRAYTAVMPDILGLQEVSTHMASLMMSRMAHITTADGGQANYEYISAGDTPLVYRRDKLRLLESGFYLYPEEIPGIGSSFNNHESKSYGFGVFEDRETGARIAVMSTHLWYMSSRPGGRTYRPRSNEARAWQIGVACARMEEIIARYDCPAVILGDFNASMDSLCLETACARGWTEAHDMTVGFRDETKGHHYCFGDGWHRDEPGTFARAIDHIIVKNADRLTIRDYRRVTDAYFDCVSDHYPVYVTVEKV